MPLISLLMVLVVLVFVVRLLVKYISMPLKQAIILTVSTVLALWLIICCMSF